METMYLLLDILIGYYIFLFLFYVVYYISKQDYLTEKYKEVIGGGYLTFMYVFPLFACGYSLWLLLKRLPEKIKSADEGIKTPREKTPDVNAAEYQPHVLESKTEESNEGDVVIFLKTKGVWNGKDKITFTGELDYIDVRDSEFYPICFGEWMNGVKFDALNGEVLELPELRLKSEEVGN